MAICRPIRTASFTAMRFKPATVAVLAKCLCGDSPLPFPYRTGAELTDFFRGLGIADNLDGRSRNNFVLSTLTAINLASPEDGILPSPKMVSIIEALMHRTYFDEASVDRVNYNESFEIVNKLLDDYDLEIVRDGPKGIARLQASAGNYVSSVLSQHRAHQKITFCPSVFRIPAEGVSRDLVSVMMPFSPHFSPVYEAIKGACRSALLRCQRADDIWEDSTIIQDIFTLIFTSNIVVVDFSEKNPNVMYETGIAHTLGKHVIPITQSMDDVPFDLKQHRVLKYLSNGEGLAKLETSLSQRLLTIVDRDNILRFQRRDGSVSGNPASERARMQPEDGEDDIPF